MNASMPARRVPHQAAEGSPTATATPLAIVSLGAAAIHFAVIPAHLVEWWAFGLFFAALGWFQALWAVAYLVGPTLQLRRLAIAVNLATVVLWAWSRTAGLPIGPEPWMPEAVGAPDVISSVLELALAIGLVGMRPTSASELAVSRGARLALAVGLVVAVATTLAIATGSG